MSKVELLDIGKSYGQFEALKSLSLTVDAGEFLVLLGPSGCGKSTLLHSIAGLEEIDSGTIRIGGRDITELEPKDRNIAMVFQSYALYPTMSVRRNLSFGLRMSGMGRNEIDERVTAAARMLQIGELLDRKPSQLSGGQRQRVAIGRAVVRKAPVFLFDEPLSNLDAKLRAEMRVEIKRLHNELKATMIYVTHDQTEAMTMASRIAIMREGRIEQLDAPQTIYDRPANLFVAGFIGTPIMNLVPGAITENGAQRLFHADGVQLDVSMVPGSWTTTGERVLLGVRPEALRVTDAQDASAFAAVLELREPLGSETLVWCRAGGCRICCKLSPEIAAHLPEKLWLVPDMRKASLFSAQTGARLQ